MNGNQETEVNVTNEVQFKWKRKPRSNAKLGLPSGNRKLKKIFKIRPSLGNY